MNSFLIGQIVNVHGVKGEVKIYTYTDDIDNISKIKEAYFDENLKEKIKIENSKIHKGMLISKIKGINSIEEALKLKNKYLYIEKEEIDESLEEDTFYIEDLIGLEVIDENGEYVGKLTYVMNTGANDVYEVDTKEHGKILLPAIAQVVKKVDIKNKKMYIEMMEGLIWEKLLY